MSLPATILAGDRLSGPDFTAILTELNRKWYARQTLTGTQASITQAIPSTLRRLTIRTSARADNGVQAQFLYCVIGGDTTNSYKHTYGQTNNTAYTGVSSSGGGGFCVAGLATGSSAPAGAFGEGTVNFAAWDVTTSYLGYDFFCGAMGTAVGNQFAIGGTGEYFGASSRTSILLYPQAGSFVADTDIQFEGVYQ